MRSRWTWTLALTLTVALLLPKIAMATSGMYRCTLANGGFAYQDRPCASERDETRIEGGEQALRHWLEQQRASRPATSSSGSGTSAPAHRAGASNTSTFAALPTASLSRAAELRLAVCSERFLHCAHSNADRMDACIAALPRCGGGITQTCCPSACITRYQSQRASGAAPPQAISEALFGTTAGVCGS